MPFADFTPAVPDKPQPERHDYLVVSEPITTSAQLRALQQDPANTTGGTRKGFPRWATWLISITVFVALWWVSMDFRGLVLVLGVFWFFAIGAHPAIHIGRAAHDLIDGDN